MPHASMPDSISAQQWLTAKAKANDDVVMNPYRYEESRQAESRKVENSSAGLSGRQFATLAPLLECLLFYRRHFFHNRGECR